MVETVISIRTARHGDEIQIARVHDAAWRDAYQGVIPGRELERMIARRGPAWWRQALAYSGEIFELYIAPEYQGAGLGRRMFDAARSDLAAHGYLSFVVWALAGNDRATEFYRRLGGRVVRRAPERFGAETRERVAFGFE
jgi:ribosomal protein S18 acetylase RimI-like enzyme